MITKEEIKKKLQEDSEWTLPDDSSDEDWDLYFQVKDEIDEEQGTSTDDSWEDTDEESF